MGDHDALATVTACLRCPQCAAAVALVGSALRCERGHAFDVARQGYVSLLTGHARAGSGDDAAMAAARERFLGAGHYAWIAEALADAAASALADGPDGCVVDLGAGTGAYLAAVLGRLPQRHGIAMDVSRYALRRAARAHPRAAAVGADTWQGLPLRDGAAAVVLNVFAPRNGLELARVLRPGGTLLVVTPTPRHLVELGPRLAPVGLDEGKQERLRRTLGPALVCEAAAPHERTLSLPRGDVRDLVGMGPNARHHDAADLDALVADLPEPLAVTASVTLSTFRRP